ncbi:hypothetical protein CEP52_013143 [Fusarium oligoseptatum]|uniref:BZIP domain-containing protein n=1 Tax=Fusarium oligoseptatum TaxID=2604345 RepID=A0A428SV40_9HYPO|nr:hypothetical protein CEP52_013143 [Fusarium oligoseptatum]
MTSAGHWKDRFTDEQLQRKRAADRLGHKKSRQRSKQTVAELEQRLRMVLEGERGTLITQLLEENAALRHKLNFYQCRLETIVQAGQECLGIGKESDPFDAGNLKPSTCLESHADTAGKGEHPFRDVSLASAKLAFEFVPSAASILHEIYSFSPLNLAEGGHEEPDSTMIAHQEVVDAVMTWKLFSGRGNAGLDLVTQSFCLTSNPPCLTRENLERAIISESIYVDVLERLICDGPEFGTKSTTETETRPKLSEMERQRRAAALRAHLAKNWERYSAQELILSLIRNFQVRNSDTVNKAWIKLKPDISGLEIDESLERDVEKIENLMTHQNFCQQYPDLSPYVNAENQDAPRHKGSLQSLGDPTSSRQATSPKDNGGFLANPPTAMLGVMPSFHGVEKGFCEQSVPPNCLRAAVPPHTGCSANAPNEAGSTVSPALRQYLFGLDTAYRGEDITAMAALTDTDFTDHATFQALAGIQ